MDEERPHDAANRRRRRGRHAAACVACHRRKQKCDGAHPCFNCNRRNVAAACTYIHQGQRQSQTGLPSTLESETAREAPPSPKPPPAHERTSSASRASHDQPEPQVGNLFRSRDAPSFFGSSYFGPQAAAKIIEAPAPDLSSGIRQEGGSTHSFRDVGGSFSQIWDLLGLLPRNKKGVDRLVQVFLAELNWTIDAIHPTSFMAKYDLFWSRKFGFDDFATIDLRWLALLFIVLAYGVFLDCPRPRNTEVQRDLQETSLRFYWAARRAIVIAPTFYGESTDLVRAGVLVTRYLIHMRRVPEAWLTTSFAMRMAQAQGIHIDGDRWRLSRKETETRRRLWSHLYMLDKTIALAIGRPFAIVDQQCYVKRATNIWLDDEPDERAATLAEFPISEPTLSICNFLAHDLAQIVGQIQERCFGLFSVSYDTVLDLDRDVLQWEKKLPPYFRLQDPDTSQDQAHPFLYWNRLQLHSMFHFTRVTLHRPYLLRQSITNRFKYSNDACISSACADLAMRMDYLRQSLPDRLKWSLGPHHLFNSALVLGIIAVKEPYTRRSHAIVEDLVAYCEIQRSDVWLNEFALAEVKILELCINKVNHVRSSQTLADSSRHMSSTSLGDMNQDLTAADVGPANLNDESFPTPETDLSADAFLGLPNLAAGGGPFQWQAPWGDSSFSMLEPPDLQQWEHVIDSITQDQMLFNLR